MADGAAVWGYYGFAGVLRLECIGVVGVEVADLASYFVIVDKGAICIYIEGRCYYVTS